MAHAATKMGNVAGEAVAATTAVVTPAAMMTSVVGSGGMSVVSVRIVRAIVVGSGGMSVVSVRTVRAIVVGSGGMSVVSVRTVRAIVVGIGGMPPPATNAAAVDSAGAARAAMATSASTGPVGI